MTDRPFRALAFSLLASTALATPAVAQSGPNDTPPPPAAQVRQDGQVPDQTEIVVTAQKREENIQNVPVSIQAIGTRRLDQLNISNFEQYTRQLPSVSFQTAQPGVTVVYMRGVASGGDGNHSGPLPSVGTYLDEQPVTTIGGTLDVHIYDIARIESLAGPQGTLYGASSEAGTIRIITNKPELNRFSGRLDLEGNAVAHGGLGGKAEGMVNVPLAKMAALRLVGFYERDAGFIDNVLGQRQYCGTATADGCLLDGISFNNAGLVRKNINKQEVYGGRAALKIDLDDNWTVTPTILHQTLHADGNFSFDPKLGDLKVDRFFDEYRKDRFTQAALTIQGKLANFDVTYAGAYLDRKDESFSDYTDYSDAYDQLYSAAGGLANYFYFQDAAGDTIDPRQTILGTDHFRKMSQEFRIASPVDNPFRVIAGAFYQRQSNDIFQNYMVRNLAPDLSVNGMPGTLWLTKQKRVDKDYALFGEASLDVVPTVTLTAGGRLFRYDNSLFGFFGFGRNPAYFQGADDNPPPNAAGSSRTGVAGCYTTSGDTLRDSQLNGTDTSLLLANVIAGTPCTNLADFVDGRLVPKRAKGHGFTHRLNAQWKPHQGLMFYATWSRGFRPGGINRRATIAPYDPDYLNNWELGWKATLLGGRLRWNGAVYHQIWRKFQYAFLGANSFTEIHNGSDARINGVETDLNYVFGGLSLSGSAAYTDAKTRQNICSIDGDNALCNGLAADFIAAPKGTRLPVTPKVKATATARYAWNVGPAAKAHVQGSVSYKSSAAANLRTAIQLVGTGEIVDPNSYMGRIRAATVFDAFAGVDWDRLSLEGFVTNLFDKREELSRTVACSSCERVLVVPGRPRTIGIRAGIKF
ncbi:TonB-dependent receptor [Sphingomonas ginkgonis]|uniref:TonB-dependent receptor n=1 Tax=Sphingomonas ginkgonis TaxID=2315330 RepID=A0A429V7W6_9SPHN|nr:TonB-dependent receptor [Sphingomonas ginkgonis]RST30035.1 TonB-dependent receptor [Sphingomonas ginkgonis]